MKKSIFLILTILLSITPTFAKATIVQAVSPYDSNNPPEQVTFKVISANEINDYGTLFYGDILEGSVIRAKDNSRLKQNATFSLKITKITHYNGEITTPENLYAKYTTELDKVEATKSVALTVGNHFVKGLTFGYRTVEGAVKNEEGNRIKSAGVALYNSTPLSYASKGKDLLINVGDNFLLNIEIVTPENKSVFDEHNYNL